MDSSANENEEIVIYSPLKGQHLIHGHGDQGQFPNQGYNDQGQFLNRGFGDQGMSQIRSHDDREERAFHNYLTLRTEDTTTTYHSSIADIHENEMPNGNELQRPPALDHDHVIVPAVLSWESITVRVKGKKGQKSSKGTVEDASVPVPDPGKTQSKGGKIIIDNVSGIVKPGTLMAIMGASGAGKSTLLNVLTCRNLKSYVLQGEVKVNGVSLGSSIRNISGYVQQDDLFLGTLTVRETLRFRAMLRMDKNIKPKDRLAKVEEVIKEMGLSKCAQTQVGSTGQKRGISGGELKRLSFACEMLTNPPIMFCDEPTSGLDTFMAQNIVQTLQNMASRQRTILCTIHQPSSEIYALFDQLLLMAEGRVAFMGSTKQALEFFSSLNFVCPPNFNPSDFFVLTLAIVPGKEDECKRKVKAICDTFVQTEQGGQIMKDVKQVSSLRRQDSLIEDAKKSESRYKTSWGRQFLSVFWRSWVSLTRDVVLLRVRAIQNLVVAVALGLIYLRLTYDQKGVMNINGAMYVLILNLSFNSMFSVVNSFPSEVPIFLREYGSGLYRVDVYFLSKILAELPTFIVFPLMYITVDYWMMGLYGTGEAYIINAAAIVLVANVAVSFGYVISTVSPNVNVGLALAPPMMIPLLLFGGFFLNDESIPVYFIWLKYLSWFKYANELVVVNQWKNVDSLSCDSGNSTIMANKCLYRNGTDVLTYLSYSKNDMSLNVGLLFALLVGYRLLAFVILLIRARLSRS
ncbi:protein white-like [Pomacea canaliculata]|uniref:protein white-like n=1 Tax=Pomacea canaliculata TaxID=400727 RepID=UPI000D72AB6B|nr:protein white-like [Pomacea canaliculata]